MLRQCYKLDETIRLDDFVCSLCGLCGLWSLSSNHGR